MSTVSVVVPFYNRAGFIGRLLDSIADQIYPVSEIFIVDNGSSVVESEKAWSVITKHPVFDRVVYLSAMKRGNANIARNVGYDLAAARYVAFIDSDDWWTENHLSDSVHILEQTGKAGCYSGAYIHDLGGRRRVLSRNISDAKDLFEFMFCSKGVLTQSSSFVISKSLVAGRVRWDEGLKRSQDLDYFLNIEMNTAGWVYKSTPQYNLDWDAGGAKGCIDGASLVNFYRKWAPFMNDNVKRTFLLKYVFVCRLRGLPVEQDWFVSELRNNKLVRFKDKFFVNRFFLKFLPIIFSVKELLSNRFNLAR